MRYCFLFFLFLSLLGPAIAGEKTIFTLTDPSGDDEGDGTLIYPIHSEAKQGDFDLVTLSARAEKDGTLFEATFARSILQPGSRAIDAGGATLASVARLGFYTFNIDIYIDTDRVNGSGYTRTFPGRVARISPRNAYEKAICLTPRPNDAMKLLSGMLQRSAEEELRAKKGRVDPEDNVQIKGTVLRDMEDRYFFPTQVRVLGSRVRFFVPGSFLGGPARSDWSYVVVVTAADIQHELDLTALILSKPSDQYLMNLRVNPGTWPDRLGTSRNDSTLLPPILDIIVPEGLKQEDVLRDFNTNEDRPVELPGVVPSP